MPDLDMLDSRVKDLERRMNTLEDRYEDVHRAVSGAPPIHRAESPDADEKARKASVKK